MPKGKKQFKQYEVVKAFRIKRNADDGYAEHGIVFVPEGTVISEVKRRRTFTYDLYSGPTIEFHVDNEKIQTVINERVLREYCTLLGTKKSITNSRARKSNSKKIIKAQKRTTNKYRFISKA